MKSFSLDHVDIDNNALLMWWDEVDSAEDTHDSDFIHPPKCRFQKSGGIIIHGELKNGHQVAVSFAEPCWKPIHES